MSLRSKILALFFACFGLMTVIAILFLFHNLHISFNELQKNLAKNQMERLVQNLDSELAHLNELNTDWANWDELYEFALGTNPGFAETNGVLALKSAQLNLLGVYNRRQQPLHIVALENNGAAPLGHYQTTLNTIIPIFAHKRTQGCGILSSTTAPIMLCWQPMRKTDGSGRLVGTVVMGRLLDAQKLEGLKKIGGIKFELSAPLPGQISKMPLQTTLAIADMHFSLSEEGVLVANLIGINERPVLAIRLLFSRDIVRSGDAIIWRVVRALLLVVALSSIVLWLGLHFLMVKRLGHLGRQLNVISHTEDWSRRVEKPSGSDELVGLSADINLLLTTIQSQMQKLEYLSQTDPLTQVANRRGFDQHLKIEMGRAAREQRPLCLLLIDADYFKRYNDHYGHPAGDAALVAIAEVLMDSISRPTDLAARLGGEEFALLLPDTNLPGAYHLAEKIHGAMAARSIEHLDSPIATHITLSIGVTCAGNEDTTAFVARADSALYQAKAAGRAQTFVLEAPELSP